MTIKSSEFHIGQRLENSKQCWHRESVPMFELVVKLEQF